MVLVLGTGTCVTRAAHLAGFDKKLGFNICFNKY